MGLDGGACVYLSVCVHVSTYPIKTTQTNTTTGALLGALLGAAKGMAAFPPRFVNGLVDTNGIRKEVNTFADLAVKRSGVKRGDGGDA